MRYCSLGSSNSSSSSSSKGKNTFLRIKIKWKKGRFRRTSKFNKNSRNYSQNNNSLFQSILLLLSQEMILLEQIVGSNYNKMEISQLLRILAALQVTSMEVVVIIITLIILVRVNLKGISHLHLHKHTCSGIVFTREIIMRMEIFRSRSIQIVLCSSSVKSP